MVLRRKVIDARAVQSSDRGDTVKFESPQSAVVDIHLAAKVLYPFNCQCTYCGRELLRKTLFIYLYIALQAIGT
jgi:hypothetical protein